MRRVCILVVALCATFAARAQSGLVDPTRPPALGDRELAGASASRSPRVQSVLISSARKLAVIDGRTVELGERVDGATLVAISETGVTLKRGEQLQQLRLYPNVQRQPVEGEADTQNKKGDAQ
jgi:MoxR-like ATPase